MRLNAPLKRTLNLQLPYVYASLEKSDLILFKDRTYEVDAAPRDGGGFLELTATELPEEI
jgi:hypothetical protein